jgi:hypothetical protein
MMKRPFLLAALAAIIFLAACSPAVATPTPVDVSAISTSAVETAYAALTASAPTATPVPTLPPTLAATSTPVATATPDYSVIKFDLIYFQNSELVVTFQLNNARGQFTGEGNGHQFECTTLSDTPDNLRCVGPYLAPGLELLFHLFAANNPTPILQVDLLVPSTFPPTPEGMRCEIEPLWVAPLTGPLGCYAVTCYIGASYYDGTPNTCEKPWRWPVP